MKVRVIALSLLLLSLYGCGSISGESTTPEQTATLPAPMVITNNAPNPETKAKQFIEAWDAGEYQAMYAMLSPLAQDGITEQEFLERLEEIKLGTALSGVSFEVVSSLIQNPRQAQVRYRIILDSAAVGDIVRETYMDLTRVEEEWRVSWTDSLLLPELESDEGLYLDVVTPIRANIYDRNGLALATQGDAAALWLVPNRIGDEDEEETMLNTLRSLLDFPYIEMIQAKYDNIRSTDFRVNLGEVSLEQLEAVSSMLSLAGGVQWDEYSTRLYVDGGLAPHAVGYVSQIQAEEFEDYLARGYRGDEYVGQIGVELEKESELRGQPGGTLYITDPGGQTREVITSRDPEPPYAVYTSLDRDLQRVTKQAIEDSEFVGAVVVLERDTGAVLAMASSPSFDPNLFDFQNPNSASGLADLFQQPNNALLNRTTDGAYPPGSVFKMITMAAALESGEYEADTIYNCGLEFRELPGITLYDWRYGKELPASGEITLLQALERSCNPYFYHIGLDLFQKGMPTAISDMAKGFGLGIPTGIEIGDEAGLVPSPETKVELYGEEWRQADPVQLAIGQSFMRVTPLQIARYVASIGNGGTLLQPQIVSRIQNAEGDTLYEFAPIEQGQVPVSQENLGYLHEAMVKVVRDPKGTAYRRFLGLNVDIAGKTGTAQTGDFTDPHAWFAGYTYEERDDLPDIVVVVLLENQGEGSDWAAPVFRRIVEAYFKGRPLSVYPWEERIRVPRAPTPTPEPEDLEVETTPSSQP